MTATEKGARCGGRLGERVTMLEIDGSLVRLGSWIHHPRYKTVRNLDGREKEEPDLDRDAGCAW